MAFVIGLFMLTTATAAATTTVAPTAVVGTAAAERVAVFLHTDARDAVGASYVARLREALAGSSAYRTVTDPASARFVVGIVTMDPDEAGSRSGAGHATVAAVTLQRHQATGLNHFVYSWVLAARPEQIDALAAELVAAIDQEIRGLDETAPSGLTADAAAPAAR